VFFRLDGDGIFRESLGAGLKRLDLEPNQVVGMNALEMFEVARPQLEQALAGETVSYQTSGELNGQQWSFLTFVTPNPGPDPGIVGFGIDTTEQHLAREAEEQVRAQMQNAQKLESLGVLAGGIAHDFNNLLTSMMGYASLALLQLPAESPSRTPISKIERGAQTAAALCKQLLAYSGKGHFVVRQVNVSQLCLDTVGLLQVSIDSNTQLELNCPLALPMTEADSPQLQQVLMNLVLNATESLDGDPGTVSLSTGVMTCDESHFASSYVVEMPPPGRYVYVEVKDTGCGMDAATREKLFDPFYSTKQPGRGLGLAAVLGIVRGHGGAIQVESEVNQGTSIRILLPLRETKAANRPAPHRSQLKHSDLTVLLADDEDSVREVARDILEAAGCRVLLACDGQEAIDLFCSRDDIDVVILDITMPRKSGIEALEAIRATGRPSRVVLSSGYNEELATGRISGPDAPTFLQKPYRAQELLVALNDARTHNPPTD